MEDLKRYITQLRHDFAKAELSEEAAGDDPVALFEKWFRDALKAEVNEPNAMGLSTVSPDGKPSSRIVLLRSFDNEGFRFYTNYESRKGVQLDANPNAALLFFWPEVERQVRVEGTISKLSTEESDEYFAGRPRQSQLGAWTSSQSKEIPSRAVLDQRFAELSEKYSDAVPRPPHWGGYLLNVRLIEFWQGRPGRLHDRIEFRREGTSWNRARLAP